MNDTVFIIRATVAAYIAGSIPFAYIFTKVFRGEDITKIGSGNPGATNVYRLYGHGLGIPVLLLDVAKGYFPAYLADRTVMAPILVPIVVLAVVLGHDFSPFLKFKGGKGVAASVGIFLFLAPAPTLIVMMIFTAVTTIFKFVSFASVMASLSFPFIAYFMGNRKYIWLSVGVAALIIFQHRSNLKRLWYGKEKRSI